MTAWKGLRREFHRSLKSLLPQRLVGWTGWADGTVVNPSRPNYIKITLQDKSETEAWNDGVPAISGLRVDLYIDPDYPGLLRAKQPRLAFKQDFPYICINFHAPNHTWPGPDTVAVEMRQFMPLHPSVNGFVLTVRAGWVETTNGLKFFANESVDLSSYKPASGARYMLVSIGDDGLLTVTSGAIKDLYSLVIGDIPERPLGHKRICAVRLHIGQAYIKDEKQNPDLLDLRFISSFDGDMFKATYDQDDDGIVDRAEKVDGVDAAGNSKYYGTNASGTPGFHELPEGGGGVEEAPLTGGPYGRQDAGWVEVGSSGGGFSPLGLILSYVAEHNSDPVDTIIEEGGFVLMIYFTSHNQNNWKSASSSYTVPSGKKLLFIQAAPNSSVADDPNYRRARLFSVTNNNELFGYGSFTTSHITWGGDLSNPTKVPEISAGQTIKLQVWNGDTNKRAMGTAAIMKLIDA